MNILQIILNIATSLPGLINAAEQLWSGFPGMGQVKKESVTGGVRTLLESAKRAGVQLGDDQIDGVLQYVSRFVDAYVEVQNAIGTFKHTIEVGADRR